MESAIEIAHKEATILALSLRFFLIAGLIYLLLYVWKKSRYVRAKIQWRYPENKQLRREIFYSAINMIIIGSGIGFAIWACKMGYGLTYNKISVYGWPYFFLSIVLMIFLHDAYFYWMHRLLHWRPLFKYVHNIHHLSVNPSPFAAFTFHPVEGFFEGMIYPVIAFTIPCNPVAIGIFTSYMVLINVLGHAGFEFFPKSFARHWLFKWHNSATHHNMHHSQVDSNFGLYFNIWDKLFKTNHPDYEARFEKIVGIRDEAAKAMKQDAKIARDNTKVKAGPEPVSV